MESAGIESACKVDSRQVRNARVRKAHVIAVSHCNDNITNQLVNENDDDDDTEEYVVEDYLDGTANTSTISQPTSPSSDVNTENLCDICWIEPKAKIVFVPCGHSRFCHKCADICFASVDRKCAVCRARIEFVMPIYN